jgi:hypothetical protein
MCVPPPGANLRDEGAIMLNKRARILTVCALALALAAAGCAHKKSVKFSKQKVAPGSNVVIIIDCPTNIQNVVLAKFMARDYRVKAFNASDLYTMKEVFDVRDFKKLAQNSSLGKDDLLINAQKAHDNLYKLSVYNYEMQKAETLGEMKDKHNVRYLILLELNDWERVSWGRAIDLAGYELVWVENYPTRYRDNLESIIDHFIESLAGM